MLHQLGYAWLSGHDGNQWWGGRGARLAACLSWHFKVPSAFSVLSCFVIICHRLSVLFLLSLPPLVFRRLMEMKHQLHQWAWTSKMEIFGNGFRTECYHVIDLFWNQTLMMFDECDAFWSLHDISHHVWPNVAKKKRPFSAAVRSGDPWSSRNTSASSGIQCSSSYRHKQIHPGEGPTLGEVRNPKKKCHTFQHYTTLYNIIHMCMTISSIK